MLREVSVAFAAGCMGALVNSVTVWFFGALGFSALLGVHIAPALTYTWLYPRIVWGGIWGMLFLLPYRAQSWQLRGLVFSLAPSAAQLLIFFPLQGKGLGGLDLGALTPLFVLFFNLVWGLTAAAWIKAIAEDRAR